MRCKAKCSWRLGIARVAVSWLMFWTTCTACLPRMDLMLNNVFEKDKMERRGHKRARLENRTAILQRYDSVFPVLNCLRQEAREELEVACTTQEMGERKQGFSLGLLSFSQCQDCLLHSEVSWKKAHGSFKAAFPRAAAWVTTRREMNLLDLRWQHHKANQA